MSGRSECWKETDMDCLIISGMSGAGKSLTVDVLEDIGYYCVDNMPASLIPRFVELFMDSSNKYKRVAFVVDVRGDNDFQKLFSTLEEIRSMGIACKVLFLDCSDEELINRHKAARRRHPLDENGQGLVSAVAEERKLLETVKDRADYLINTTSLSSQDLREHLMNLFFIGDDKKRMMISINTFGYKYGIPHESDMVWDVRFLKNPFYKPELRDQSGLDRMVSEYVFSFPAAEQFLDTLVDLLETLFPLYLTEGKTSLVISIGCTGGRHRSVAVGQRLYERLSAHGHHVVIRHRDMEKG